MQKVFNLYLIKKVTIEEVETIMNAHSSWVKIINKEDLYGVKYNNNKIVLLLYHKNCPMKFFISIEFAKEHFMVIGNGVKDKIGLKLEKYINLPETY